MINALPLWGEARGTQNRQEMGLKIKVNQPKRLFALLCNFNVIFRRLGVAQASLKRVGYFLVHMVNSDSDGYLFFICLHSDTDDKF